MRWMSLLVIGWLVGCQGAARAPEAARAMRAAASDARPGAVYSVPALQAVCAPPIGWKAEPAEHLDRHTRQVWLSPSGKTAYGVIYFDMPLPVGPDLALWGFLREMEKHEGRAVLLSQSRDAHLPGIRFVAEGQHYRIRTNLIVRGWRGWAVYAGTLRDKPVAEEELASAESAREHTRVGRGEIARRSVARPEPPEMAQGK